MPWQPKDLMDTKREFLELALQDGANRRELCRRFGISPKTGYAILNRHAANPATALEERSRRPLHSPANTPPDMEAAVLALRRRHPAWGGRKLARCLIDSGCGSVPSPSTITAILHRHGLITPKASEAATPWQRFEHEAPNSLWQIDFKGYVETPAGRCHPLTMLDDHSRFNLTVTACARQDGDTVRAQLQRVFERYGLPVRMNSDNGAPWGAPRASGQSLTVLGVWLTRLGIRLSHSAPYHPQTNGKLERFHRSLKAEVLNGRSFSDLLQAQKAFDRWRRVYNHERPHEALDMHTPAQRYRVSDRPMPKKLVPFEYAPDDEVVKVGWNGKVRFKGRLLHVSTALDRTPIAMRPDPLHDGCFDAYFCHHKFMRVDLNQPDETV
jgi:transposase InsO family protein